MKIICETSRCHWKVFLNFFSESLEKPETFKSSWWLKSCFSPFRLGVSILFENVFYYLDLFKEESEILITGTYQLSQIIFYLAELMGKHKKKYFRVMMTNKRDVLWIMFIAERIFTNKKLYKPFMPNNKKLKM